MKIPLNCRFILSTLLFFLTFLNQAQSWQWAKRIGSANDNITSTSGQYNEMITDLKVDKVGNTYAVGYFFNNTCFQNAEIFGTQTPPGFGERDAYLVKYSSCGKTLWYRRMGGPQTDEATSLVLDDKGQILMTGFCTAGPNNFGDGVHDTVTNVGVFLARFDTAGNFKDVNSVPQYQKLLITSQGDYLITDGLTGVKVNTLGISVATYTYAVPTPYYPSVQWITMDKNDNIYICGTFNNTVNIGPSTILLPISSTLIANTYATNALIMKFSPLGNMLWYQRGTTSASDALISCAADTSAMRVAAGGISWNGVNLFTYTFNGGVGTQCNTFMLLDAATGTLISAKTGSANFQGYIAPCSTDRDNNFHCKGVINGSLAFNTTTYPAAGTPGNRQNCIGRFDAAGNFVDINLLPQVGNSNNRERGNTLDISEQGNIYIGGMFGGTLDSAGIQVTPVGGSMEDGFVAKYGFACGSVTTNLSPVPPTGLAAVYQPTLSNYVTWVDNAQYETGYELWCLGGSITAYSLIATLPANTTTYTHSNLSYTTTYCYKARAINSTGPSLFTNIGCASTPAAPTNTTTNPVGIAEVSLLADVSVFPNPTAGEIALQFVSTGNSAKIEVMDLIGRVVYSEKIITIPGENKQHLQMPKEKGLYVVKISTHNATVIKKIAVE